MSARELPRYTHTTTFDSVDIPTMHRMSDDEYRQILDEIVFVDHHMVLRCSRTSAPIATSQEQLDIFIERLRECRDRLEPQG